MIDDLRRLAFMAVAVIAIVAGLVGFGLGRTIKPSLKVAALRDTIRIADTIAIVRTDTVVKYQRRVDTVRAALEAVDTLVVIRDDSTLHVIGSPSDSAVVVSHVVVGDIQALRLTVATQDTLILSLYQRDTTRLWQIASRDRLIRELSKRRCGRRCGFLLGVGASVLVYNAVK